MLGGGSMAGLLRFQNTDLTEANDQLGRMALAIGTELNAQHRLGVDLNGASGRDLFKPIAIADAIPLPGNSGNAVLRTTVSNASALVASSYHVAFDAGGGIDVKRLSDGKTSHFVGALPIQLDGLQFRSGQRFGRRWRWLHRAAVRGCGRRDAVGADFAARARGGQPGSGAQWQRQQWHPDGRRAGGDPGPTPTSARRSR